jgi:hypothetical protein
VRELGLKMNKLDLVGVADKLQIMPPWSFSGNLPMMNR